MNSQACEKTLDETQLGYTQRGESPEEAMLEPKLKFRGLRATKRPLMRMLSYILTRWAFTTTISICIVMVLNVYSSKVVMSKAVKRQFNAIITGLSIILGLTIASSLNGMAGDLRWWILSRRHRSRRKVELILQADRMSHLVKLALRSRRISLHLAAASWMLVLMATQIGVATLGLCYSTDFNENTALLVPGQVSIPNLSNVETNKIVSSRSLSMGAQQYTANSYGTVSIAYNTKSMNEQQTPGTIWFNGDPLMFCGETSCRYIFHEISTKSIANTDTNSITVTTSRTIDASSNCNSWPVTKGGDGTTKNITVATSDGNIDVTIPIVIGNYETVFMTNISTDCGEGCSEIYAFEASATAPWFYKCNITLGNVANAIIPQHQVSANFTALVSASIALQGYAASSMVNDTNIQYQIYPAESIFGVPVNGNTTNMAWLLSRFTIGVVAATADNNEMIVVSGNEPQTGSRLSVTHWSMITLILSLIAIFQLVLGLGTAYLANRVVIPERELIETAQVLRAMTNHYHPAENDTTRRSLSGDRKAKVTWIFRDSKVSEGIYDLHMESEGPAAKEDED